MAATAPLPRASGLKKQLKIDSKHPAQVLFKAYLIRRAVFTHLELQLPKLADIIQLYGTFQFFKAAFGMNDMGEFLSEDDRLKHLNGNGDDEDEEAASDDNADTQLVTSYKSRRLLMTFCQRSTATSARS